MTMHIDYVKQFHLTVSSQYGSVTGEGWYNPGSVADVTIDATIVDTGAGSRVRFVEWTGDASGSSPSTQVVMDRPKHVIASWETQFYLKVLSNPEGLVQLQREGWYDEASTVSLAADGQVREYAFLNWSLDGTTFSDRVISVMMDKPYQAVAHYVIPTITVQPVNPEVNVTAGEQEAIIVSVLPASYQTVLVEYSINALNWIVLAQGSTDSSGTFATVFSPPSMGTWYLRASILNPGGQPIVISETRPFTAVPESRSPLLLFTSLFLIVSLFLEVRTRRNRDIHPRNRVERQT
jgi:hypothetical protein